MYIYGKCIYWMYVLLWAKKYIIILLSVVQFFFLVVDVALYITHRPREKRNKRYRHKKQREKHSVYYTLHTNREMKFLLQKQKQEKKQYFPHKHSTGKRENFTTY